MRTGYVVMANGVASRAAFGGLAGNDESGRDYRNEKSYNPVFRHRFIPLSPLRHSNLAETSTEVKVASGESGSNHRSLRRSRAGVVYLVAATTRPSRTFRAEQTSSKLFASKCSRMVRYCVDRFAPKTVTPVKLLCPHNIGAQKCTEARNEYVRVDSNKTITPHTAQHSLFWLYVSSIATDFLRRLSCRRPPHERSRN